ncbi:MAG TPA: hypothetical protein VLZ06_00945 [Solirubrobacteraceae bacterium]|nr:hypothetical protein [Solirubrobacteraceae bacterium]
MLVACLMATMAVIGCVMATGASAAAPTWFECAKASPKNTGNYRDKACAEPSTPGQGAYVLKVGLGNKDVGKAFKTKSGEVNLHVASWLHESFVCAEMENDCRVKCKKASMTGRDVLPSSEEEVQIVFSTCTLFTSKCASPGAAKPGEIRTTVLAGELGYLNESGSVGVKLENSSSPGGTIAEFSCGTPKEHFSGDYTKARLFGAIIGQQQLDVNHVTKERRIAFVSAAQYGEQEFSYPVEGPPPGVEHVKYKPIVNLLGWSDELSEIEKFERPANVLQAEPCAEWISRESNAFTECTPVEYVGLDGAFLGKGATVEVKA